MGNTLQREKIETMIKVTYIDSAGTDETIIAAARQSTDGAFRGWGTPEKPGDEKLLKYLWDHRHSVPFEFCQLHIQIDAPIFVARQVYTHRTFSRSEMSGRYVEMALDFHEPNAWRVQATKNKQASAGVLDAIKQSVATNIYRGALQAIEHAYTALLALGVSREQARYILPLSTMTRWRMSGDLRCWLAFLDLRMASDVQEETRDLANQVAAIIHERWPRTAEVAGLPKVDK